MKKLIVLIIGIFISFIIQAQVPQPGIIWSNTYGGSSWDGAFSIQQTIDDGYVVAGTTHSNDGDVSGNHGLTDFWIIKIDDNGDTTWTKTVGGSGWDGSRSIQQTLDGGYIVAGYTTSITTPWNEDCFVVKLDVSGEFEWSKTIDESNNDRANSIQQTSDGGYVVAGGTGIVGDCWVIKLNSSGQVTWSKVYGGTLFDVAYSIKQTTDGGFIIAGGTQSKCGNEPENQDHYDSDYFVIKLDIDGNIVWSKCLGGSGDEGAQSIQQSNDGGYIVCGSTLSDDGNVPENHGRSDYWIIKLNSEGQITWLKVYGGSEDDWASSIQQTCDGGYIISGQTKSNDGDVSGSHGNYDFWVVKIDSNGDIDWTKTLGGSSNENATSILQTSEGKYVVAGYTRSNNGDVNGNHGSSDVWVVKFDATTPGSMPAYLPFVENWETENGTLQENDTIYSDITYYWTFETDHQGDGRARYGTNSYKYNTRYGGLTMDRKYSYGDFVTNSAILTLNLSNYKTAADLELAFAWTDHGNEEHAHDKVWIRGSINDEWVEIYDLDPLTSPDNEFQEIQNLDIDAVLAAADPTQMVGSTFQVRFGQMDNFPTGYDGLTFDDIRIYQSYPCLLDHTNLPFTENWETFDGEQKTDASFCFPSHSWTFDTDHQGDGRFRFGTLSYKYHSEYGGLTLDRNYSYGDFVTNSATLTLNLDDYVSSSNLELSFAWTDHGNEEHPQDKVWIRGSKNDEWVEIYDLDPLSNPDNEFQEVQGLDIDATLANASPSQVVGSSFQVKFGQMDNYPTGYDGLTFDDIVVEEVSAKSEEIISTGDEIGQNIKIYYFDGNINVRSFIEAVFHEKHILVYDLFGRTIVNRKIPPGSLSKIEVAPCSCYMVVKVISNNHLTVEKVFVR